MQLLLMRHGAAESHAASDFDRRLTAAGRVAVAACAERLLARHIRVEKILVSPYIRTRETADIMAAKLAPGKVVICAQVAPGATPADALAGIEAAALGLSALLVVMHQPTVSRLILYLTGEERPMQPADLAVIEAPAPASGCCELICVL